MPRAPVPTSRGEFSPARIRLMTWWFQWPHRSATFLERLWQPAIKGKEKIRHLYYATPPIGRSLSKGTNHSHIFFALQSRFYCSMINNASQWLRIRLKCALPREQRSGGLAPPTKQCVLVTKGNYAYLV